VTDHAPRPQRLQVLFQDAHLVVVDKPPGLLSVQPPRGQRGGEKDVEQVLRILGLEAAPVHRLDRETSGVMLCARDAATREQLMALFKGRAIRKRYLAIVQGSPRAESGVWNFPIRDLGAHAEVSPAGQPAETRWRILERAGPVVLMDMELVTGRHNQARLHAAHAGMPIAGETKYALRRDARLRHKRCALHAARLELTLPWESEARTFEAPLPEDMQRLLEKARHAGPARS
jgi:RluA family pseudouridine synthase